MANNNTGNKSKKTGNAQYSYSPPTVQCQTPFLNPDWLSFQVIPPGYTLGMMFCGVEYPFGQFRSPPQAVKPPSFFCSPPHWQSLKQGGKIVFILG